ncbi:RnfH family protein [Candidatus Aalborgicola defluviihabitans]|jgi:putative ubiquitin-RnfH superfamily antitoxin RatB of RatAB toxin-antitoxin module|uniref:RnfH family protein n=1 Tax=Candidatus Aalborgicola defluviihabitans TaxID=3386187 RepID=UPI001E0E7ACA|nr:RnfH family protein [Burkholderiales bacterium]MBK6567774.1 RnfH family protein [Burkholderiales bacterium]MBK7282186.1 RnfH family protein [Burkholderiales bacterium]MBK7313160.1 RnfH family protein [Burkholderiales bacterium]MBL0245622.1 RnfH family protein [Rhodoferax sp.]
MVISITLVHSPRPREVVELPLELENGATVAQALQACGFQALLARPAEQPAGMGIWGKRVSPAHVLRDQDRLELYRPLTVDPKVARRARFARQGAKKKAAGLFATRRAGAKAGY